MKIRIEDLGEPELEFGGGERDKDPKNIMPRVGPFGSSDDIEPRVIRLGLVALPSEIERVQSWIGRIHQPLLSQESNARRFTEFPGCKAAIRSRFEIPTQFIKELNESRYDLAKGLHPQRRFAELLNLYNAAITTMFADRRPDCILVCFPEEVARFRITNPRLTLHEQRILERWSEEESSAQGSLFEPTPEERRATSELLPQAEELLFRNFHRALKAACMMEHNAVPLQILRRQTYISAEAKQSDATRAWNLSLALYYKAGNIPWRPADLRSDTCFVGVSFHHLKRRSGDLVYASVAQAFSNNTEPFALKGTAIPREQIRNKQPYLTQAQASILITNVLREYENRLGEGSRPSRVVLHKTSKYQPEEEEGFREAILDEVAGCELVSLSPTGFRLLRRGMREPLRGTLCTVEERDTYLFTTGYVPWWGEYPGPHIPAPVKIEVVGNGDVKERASEILALTKMNWNSAEGIGRYPITISFARRVGMTMTEMDEDVVPNPLYRFYM